jgi:hypothetical protein
MDQKWAPDNYPVRDPRSNKKNQGKIVNPVRNVQVGGDGNMIKAGSPQKGENKLGVEKPGK